MSGAYLLNSTLARDAAASAVVMAPVLFSVVGNSKAPDVVQAAQIIYPDPDCGSDCAPGNAGQQSRSGEAAIPKSQSLVSDGSVGTPPSQPLPPRHRILVLKANFCRYWPAYQREDQPQRFACGAKAWRMQCARVRQMRCRRERKLPARQEEEVLL
jgi:hypothetical protein